MFRIVKRPFFITIITGKPLERIQSVVGYSSVAAADNLHMGIGKMTLAKDLACLIGNNSIEVDAGKPKSRMELKRYLELRIKKRVKEQYINGKFQGLVSNVIANTKTLQDAYNCIRLNSNVDVAVGNDNICFESMAKELRCGNFDVNANTFSISTKGTRKEVLVLPNLMLKVVQEAIRIVLEVVYRPHFSKISHGCRSGRGHRTALKYVRKEISSPDWWFTVLINKKLDGCILDKLLSVMEEKIEDPSLYCIIRSMFNAQVLNLEFGGFPKGQGLPQEGVLSPILMNIYLDLFDHEFYRLTMKYEALDRDIDTAQRSCSKLRGWFRRHLKTNDRSCVDEEIFNVKIHCCRLMDEILFAVSGSKDVALDFRTEILNYLKMSLYLDIDDQTEIFPCYGPRGINFLGTLIKRRVKESPRMKAVHKLKEKVELFAIQKQQAWNAGTVRIGKKWLAYGLKKVKESEIRHLADSNSVLSQISHLRKSGMETDHWYKHLLKIWMQEVNVKAAESEDSILSKYVSEPAMPKELRNSFYEFQKRAEEYIVSETASTLSLLPNSGSSVKPLIKTEIIAPVDAIKKCLLRYGLTTSKGYPCASSSLILLDSSEIIDWFSGIVRRWLRWYGECDNFSEIKLLIAHQIRKSCVRTLAAKYRMHENEIENKFDTELSRIPSTQDIEQEMVDETSATQAYENDEALMYGISYSGLLLLSLSRMVSQSRPCSCFVMGCLAPAPCVYSLHVMERQKFPGWKSGFPSFIHPSLNRKRIGLCKKHLKDLYLGHISLQSIDFSSFKCNENVR
ncbi:nuclear intron maturase 4, mitochondrial [Ziziphus jujuba]|uniref:Nuclear intron maturase 4, mitochondrial n=1 Tax=Ziziphus jujuba TaxID=326968 RepID=A0ABM4ADY5_ZIZJJ|nr:nuclear intron maturase 4, mitochondrial [Ziziphus jujuba]XP_060674950.1 nuclear intron maturase 4, mitochondrial [Ziziphus jujuba]XP_060674951.1 nuclear intron maturase 4, mitochondrial [Ziziphus jujuba]XP_060674952.1 nuclear intron maturase 4, mitochondrial [Ziziphus jujuba]XP_060674953.1 nuclear intron maturase 4, mitochondrial [Ziziphus jujuba]XP_060674954.1 nuclear intron maturase 4, mitochondrial [Ziziphus jujuba]